MAAPSTSTWSRYPPKSSFGPQRHSARAPSASMLQQVRIFTHIARLSSVLRLLARLSKRHSACSCIYDPCAFTPSCTFAPFLKISAPSIHAQSNRPHLEWSNTPSGSRICGQEADLTLPRWQSDVLHRGARGCAGAEDRRGAHVRRRTMGRPRG